MTCINTYHGSMFRGHNNPAEEAQRLEWAERKLKEMADYDVRQLGLCINMEYGEHILDSWAAEDLKFLRNDELIEVILNEQE